MILGHAAGVTAALAIEASLGPKSLTLYLTLSRTCMQRICNFNPVPFPRVPRLNADDPCPRTGRVLLIPLHPRSSCPASRSPRRAFGDSCNEGNVHRSLNLALELIPRLVFLTLDLGLKIPD